MRKKILVNKYDLRNALLKLPAVHVPKKGWCIPIKELNNAIDDMPAANKEEVLNYFLNIKGQSKTTLRRLEEMQEKWDKDVADLGNSLSKLLSAKPEPPEYKGMNPKPQYQDYYPKKKKQDESDKDIDVFERP